VDYLITWRDNEFVGRVSLTPRRRAGANRRCFARRREAEARPHVIIDLEPERPPFIYLVVMNLGRTMASNVRFEFNPPIQSSQDPQWRLPIGRIKLFTSGIPSLAPGKRHVTFFDSIVLRQELGLPDNYEVRVSYDGEDRKSFVDTQRLDLDLYRDLRPVQRDTIHQVSLTLKKIEQRMTSWTSTLGGLLVMSPDEVHEGHEAIRAELSERTAANGLAGRDGSGSLLGALIEIVRRLRRRR
jgi:hypothetical protein